MTPEFRDYLGRVVRAAWLAWANQQPYKDSWMLAYDDLPDDHREVDRLIGETIFNLAAGSYAAGLTPEAIMHRDPMKWVDVREQVVGRLDAGPPPIRPVPPAALPNLDLEPPGMDWSHVVIYGICPECGLYTDRRPYQSNGQVIRDDVTGYQATLIQHLIRCAACGNTWYTHETLPGRAAVRKAEPNA